MTTSRRTFLKTSLAVSAATALSRTPIAGAEKSTARDYYELRAYRMKPGGSSAHAAATLRQRAVKGGRKRCMGEGKPG